MTVRDPTGTAGYDPDAAAADAAALPETPRPEHAPPETRPAPVTGPSPARRRARRWRLLVVGAVLVGAAAFLLAEGLGGSLDYFDTVDQALAHRAQLGSTTFRLEGLVEPGTVHSTAHGVDFVAKGSHGSVPVVNTGSPPQLFQPNIPVVVVGHFAGAVFRSDQIIVDHSSQYIEAHPNRVRAPNGSVR